MNLPSWVAAIALDDDALAAVGNRGLVRRAQRLISDGAVALVDVTAAEVTLRCEAATVRVLPGGPAALRCSCPVAGVCVHAMAACLWARGVLDVSAVGSAGASAGDGPVADAVADLLDWDPAAVNRSAGIAAVRRVAARAHDVAGVVIDRGPARAMISWPGSPQVIAVAGAGFAGMVVEGTHSDLAERAWKLDAVIRVFAAHRRSWEWPDGLADDGRLQADQRDAAAELAAVIERIVTDGISRAGHDAPERLTRAALRARLEDLPLLARLASRAAAQLAALVRRTDDVTETQALSGLAQAWMLGLTLSSRPRPPAALLGRSSRSDQNADVGTLIPLAVRWWRSPTGARGLTLHAWDADAGRLEEATTGRAAGVDPGFARSWDAPLLWGASASALCSGRLTVTGAERRDDGTLSATSRTHVVAGTWEGLDLDVVAQAVNAATSGLARTGFGAGGERLTIIRPRRSFGLGAIELDEVAQVLVWPVTDVTGRTHRLALAADEVNVALLTWIVELSSVLAIVVVGDRPEAAFLPGKGGPRLISLTLTPLPVRAVGPSWRRRLLKLDHHVRAVVPVREPDDLQRLCGSIGDVVMAVAAGGRAQVLPRQVDVLTLRRREASDLGLTTLADATAPLLTSVPTAASLLRVRFVLDRLETLLAD